MTYTEVTGDLFDLDLPAIGHGANCQGVMSAGVAKIVRSKYPDMFLYYQKLCREGQLRPGHIFPWRDVDGKMIYNLATQDQPGADASYWAIYRSVRSMLMHAELARVSKIGIPRIGAGIGGLDWHKVKLTLQTLARDSSVELVVVTLP